MPFLPFALLPCVLVLLRASVALADTGYKCVDTQGRIAFQDHPCPSDQRASSFRYESAVVAPAPATPHDPAPSAVVTPALPAEVRDAEPRRFAVPNLFACTRGDGGEPYYSDSGDTEPYTVPLGVLGYPSRSLGEVYGGRDGVGVSAPEFSHPRVLPPDAASAVAGASVWVRDDCRALPAREACRVRNRQLDEVRSKLRRAFKDQRATLEPRERELSEQLAGC